MVGFTLSPAIIQLGLSGKWPNDLRAVQRIKAAFYIKIAEGLSKQFHLTVQPYPDCVHILKVRLCETQ
jgi:U3 small nucleolar RNA-associated protein 22